jgi:hypothetical protein
MKRKRYIRVNVTADHIAQGEVGNEHQCPIALALYERLGEHAYVSVGTLKTHIESPSLSGAFMNLPRAQAFVAAFDTGQAVNTGVYVLRRVR